MQRSGASARQPLVPSARRCAGRRRCRGASSSARRGVFCSGAPAGQAERAEAPPPPPSLAAKPAQQARDTALDDIPAGFAPKTVGLGDIVSLWVTNIAQTYGNAPSTDNAPVADGVLDDLVGRPLFLALYDYFLAKGSVFKLAFGPKTFYVVSDPVVAKHVLRTSNLSFDKGLLAEILAPIMGTGLIPADFETWRTRRKALVPGFHSAWLSNMMGLFAHCCGPAEAKLDAAAAGGAAVDMEALFCSLSLDIIGLSVFNYPFGSVTTESPLIRAVYNVLREAEHRSTFYFPYWNIPGADLVVPRQVAFRRDMAVINDTLAMLIASAQACASVGDLAELEARDYDNVKDPSLLRFLVDLRGEKTTNAQLRDDLVTMLIAGHETTAAVLTWALFQLAQHPASLAALRAELDEVLPGGRAPVYGDVPRLLRTRLAVAESLRLYPQPPILIRRALEEVQLPRGGARAAVTLPKGADVFISTWNLHRSPALWGPMAGEWDPDRFLRATTPADEAAVPGWAGVQPLDPASPTTLYPNETLADFAFLPFGGGARKCIGDQFAVLESTVVLARLLQRYDFTLAGPPEGVGMVTGATIHTANGLMMRVARRPGW